MERMALWRRLGRSWVSGQVCAGLVVLDLCPETVGGHRGLERVAGEQNGGALGRGEGMGVAWHPEQAPNPQPLLEQSSMGHLDL